MRLPSFIVALVIAIVGTLCPQGAGTERGSEQSLENLRVHARGSSGGERARLYMELAQREVELGNKQFDSGEAEQARQSVQQATEDAQAAADAATSSGGRLKNTEMEMHKLARRLNDIEHALPVEDRPAVKAAGDKLHDLDRALLERMFHHKEHKEK